jgi:hypothetical protein
MRALERGAYLVPFRTRAGYRTMLGCCDLRISQTGSAVTVPHVIVRWHAAFNAPAEASWSDLAAAAQIQRTLDALQGVSSVTVQGLSRKAVRARLARGIDTGPGHPVAKGTCAEARAGGAHPSVTLERVSPTRVVAHVRAPVNVAVELDIDLSDEGGAAREPIDATAAPCGIHDVTFARGFKLAPGTAVADSRVLVRVTPLAGPAQPGVTRNLSRLIAPTT